MDGVEGTLSWQWKSFKELSLLELHALFLLRSQVFVVEQNCVYQDPDNYDLHSLHLLIKEGDKLVAYLRIIVPQKLEKLSIGRVVVAKSHRQYGLGKRAMERGIERCQKDFPQQQISISAQVYLLTFYQGLGFVAISDVYDEDGIDHIDMVYVKPD